MKDIIDYLDKELIIGSREVFAVGEIDDEFYIKIMRNLSILEQSKKAPLTVYLASPGGSVTLALGIYDRVLQLPFEVKMVVFGEAYSAASLILQAADVRAMSKNSLLMIHDLSSECVGKTRDVQSELKITKYLTSCMISIYAERSRMTESQIKNKFNYSDWYLTSKDALDLGFIDERI